MMLVGLQNDGQAVPIARTAAASAPAAFSALLAGPTHYEGEEREWADLLHVSVVKAARAQIKTSLQVFSLSSSYSLDSPEGLELLEETILTDRFGGAGAEDADTVDALIGEADADGDGRVDFAKSSSVPAYFLEV